MALPAGTYSPVKYSVRDKGGEIGRFEAYGLLLTDVNFAANNALADAFLTLQFAIQLGRVVSRTYENHIIINPTGNASSASAQRENKLLVRYHDVTTQEKLTATVPCIDLPNLVFETDAKDFVSKTLWGTTVNTVMTNWVTAWQGFIANPRTDNLTIIDSLEFVGRNT